MASFTCLLTVAWARSAGCSGDEAMADVHRLFETRRCPVCEDDFETGTELFKHIKRAHPPQHCCNVCAAKFRARNGLLKHLSEEHQLKPRCKECCQKRFPSFEALARHSQAKRPDGSH